MRREHPMRLVMFGSALVAAVTLAACNKTDDVSASPHRGGGRFLGSGLVDRSQKMTVAARAMAERKTVGHRS